MIGLFYLLVATSVILMICNLIFIITAYQIPEYISPTASFIIFIVLTAISLIFASAGFHIEFLIPFIF